MAKSGQGWREELNDQICWRFSNYTYVVKHTLSKFERDLLYLRPYYEFPLPCEPRTAAHDNPPSNRSHENGTPFPDKRAHTFPLSGVENTRAAEVRFPALVDKSWSFPFTAADIKSMCHWIENLNKELKSMIVSLEEVTAMAFLSFFILLTIRAIIICQSTTPT